MTIKKVSWIFSIGIMVSAFSFMEVFSMEVDDSTNTFHRKKDERRDRSLSPVDASGRPPEKRRDLVEERVDDSAGDTPPGNTPPLSSLRS